MRAPAEGPGAHPVTITVDTAHPGPAVPGDFLIVTRTKSHLGLYGRKLQELGIPHEVTGGSAVDDVPELALLHTALHAALRPDDPVALVAALRGELFGVSDTTLYVFKRAKGRFSFQAPLPVGLDAADAEAPVHRARQLLEGVGRGLDAAPDLVGVTAFSADVME